MLQLKVGTTSMWRYPTWCLWSAGQAHWVQIRFCNRARIAMLPWTCFSDNTTHTHRQTHMRHHEEDWRRGFSFYIHAWKHVHFEFFWSNQNWGPNWIYSFLVQAYTGFHDVSCGFVYDLCCDLVVRPQLHLVSDFCLDPHLAAQHPQYTLDNVSFRGPYEGFSVVVRCGWCSSHPAGFGFWATASGWAFHCLGKLQGLVDLQRGNLRVTGEMVTGMLLTWIFLKLVGVMPKPLVRVGKIR